jgi:hypothetical protein
VRYTKEMRSLPAARTPWRPMSVEAALSGLSEGPRLDVRR